jgi:alkanesulfonate monooxygenase SsuD/methylene tetrahydromethanopterin reductase-like flavin-dependent oxidoreductase (luciferase family)
LVGTAERIFEKLNMLSSAGLDGVLLTWVDYADGVERFNRDVLPLLEQAGLRQPFAGLSSQFAGSSSQTASAG